METPVTALDPADPGIPGLEAALGVPSAADVCLAPHSDDACFSLGHLLAQRRAGTVVTVFPVSSYAAPGTGLEGDVLSVTRCRLGEDREFARRAGVGARSLGLPDALVRGEPAFVSGSPDSAREAAGRIVASVASATFGPRLGMRPDPRPWLFCPMGIGGHRDHLAVLLAVLGLARLGRRYRLAFYEDLHYASNPVARSKGLRRFASLTGSLGLRRLRHDLDAEGLATKMALVGCYPSQLEPRLATIEAWRPAVADPDVGPHEAVWIPQADLRQSSG